MATIECIGSSTKAIPLTEDHIKQLRQMLLRYSEKDTRHRGNYNYKTHWNTLAAGGRQQSESTEAEARIAGTVRFVSGGEMPW